MNSRTWHHTNWPVIQDHFQGTQVACRLDQNRYRKVRSAHSPETQLPVLTIVLPSLLFSLEAQKRAWTVTRNPSGKSR